MRHGEHHGAAITTYQAFLQYPDPRHAGDQRFSAFKMQARRCAGGRL